jgi:hypothetical protein
LFLTKCQFRLQLSSQPTQIPLFAIQAIETLQISVWGPLSYPICVTQCESKQKKQGTPTIQKVVPLAMILEGDFKITSAGLYFSDNVVNLRSTTESAILRRLPSKMCGGLAAVSAVDYVETTQRYRTCHPENSGHRE